MKPIERPKVYSMRNVYAHFAEKLLKENPDWWSKYEKRLKLKNCYIYAQGPNGKPVLKMSWLLWKEIVERFYFKAKNAIIEGETLRIGGNVGKIRGIRIERNFNKPVVNWGETHRANIRQPNGKLKRVFYTEEDYCRIQWAKFGMLTNESCYNFDPAKENMATHKGFTAEFIQAQKDDPLLKYRYKYYPIRKKQCNTPTAPCETSSEE